MAISGSHAVSSGPPGQPDIAYTPDYAKFQARAQRRLAADDEGARTQRDLPAGFPAQVTGPLVWEGATVGATYDWNLVLSAADVAELEAALAHFKGLGLPPGRVSAETFPLPQLHERLRALSRELHQGHGFQVVRGVPVARHSRGDNLLLFAGLASHVAPVRGRQDRDAATGADVVLAHIRDLTAQTDARAIGAPAYTTEKQVFHTDAGDVIALFALGEAAEGGQSYLASGLRVYNELAATRPDLVRTLARPWAFDEYGRSDRPYSLRPLLHYLPSNDDHQPARLSIQYARRGFTGYWGLPRTETIPPISEAQAEALDALHFAAEKHALALDFRAGDIQFANNLSILHARGGFRDSPDKHRHLVRLWLRDPALAWPTPPALADRWARVYDGVDSDTAVLPLEPVIRGASRGKLEK